MSQTHQADFAWGKRIRPAFATEAWKREKKGREAVLWSLLGHSWGHLSCGYTRRVHEYQWRWSAAILHVTHHIFLRVNAFPAIEGLRGKGEMSRMRVGCSLKTKDGLLDIWTSTPDYIKLYVPWGISADGFKALVCLCNTNSQGTQSEHLWAILWRRRNQSKANICLWKCVLYCSRIYKP